MHQATDRQLEVLSFIKSYIKYIGIPPSRMDIANFFEFGQNSATDHIQALQNKGYLTIIPGVSRGITITNKGKRVK